MVIVVASDSKILKVCHSGVESSNTETAGKPGFVRFCKEIV